MSKLESIKRNVPKVAIENYFWVLSGQPKSGKTSFFGKLMVDYFKNPDIGLLVAFEKGYQALDINAVDIENWGDFEDLADELVENRDKVPYRFLGLDTVDVLYEMAVDQVIIEWNRKNPSKRTTDIGGVGAKGSADSGYGIGNDYVKIKIRKVLAKLTNAGYGIMAITHSKNTKVKQRDGLEYDQLTLSLPPTARQVFVNSADFVLFLTSDKEKTKEGLETNRVIHFRTDGYVEAGSRFGDWLPDSIDYDIDTFINVVHGAIKSSLGDKAVDMKKIAREQEEERETKVSEFIESTKGTDPKTLKANISELTSQMDKTKKKALAKQLDNEFGSANFNEYDDVDMLNRTLELAQEVLG